MHRVRSAVNLTMGKISTTAVLANGKSIKVDDLKIGDVISVRTGDMVLADGIVSKGQAVLDERYCSDRCCVVLCCAVLCCAVLCCALQCCGRWWHYDVVMRSVSFFLFLVVPCYSSALTGEALPIAKTKGDTPILSNLMIFRTTASLSLSRRQTLSD